MKTLLNYQKEKFESVFKENPFRLLDVGCSGGIPAEWREIDPFAKVIGVDINVQEVLRLNAEEKNKNVQYFAGNLELPPEHPIRRERGHGFLCESHQQFAKTSAWDAYERSKKADNCSTALKQPDCIDIKQLFALEKFRYIDFIKIDIDGPDFDVLQDLESSLEPLGVLGLKLEVNFNGSSNPHDHTFHNTDRLLRKNGFELIDLEIRRYTKKALPGRFDGNFFAQTQKGAVTQGDALYFKKAEAVKTDPRKIIKLIFLLTLYDHLDSAAQILSESDLKEDFKKGWLDLASNQQGFKNYKTLMEQWEKDPKLFYKNPE